MFSILFLNDETKKYVFLKTALPSGLKHKGGTQNLSNESYCISVCKASEYVEEGRTRGCGNAIQTQFCTYIAVYLKKELPGHCVVHHNVTT